MKPTLLLLLALSVTAFAQNLPKPQIRLVSVTDTFNNEFAMKAYEIEVQNWDQFSNELFQSAPALPPCGLNANASRTWINIYDHTGRRFYGWCAISDSSELASLRFNISESAPQPKKLFIDLVDRAEGRIVRSNRVTVQ